MDIMNKKVTIVVPVYKDWETLQLCIESLKAYVDERHHILLVNDCSPEWETIETNILESIGDDKRFQYVKNPENMGFVKTCNRAVFELDQTSNDIFLLNSDTEVTEGFLEEMLEVLYLHEKHGVVCPRSNNATILTIPSKNNLGRHLEPDESFDVFNYMKTVLPRYTIMPTGVGFAFLIKRSLIKRFGLFDEAYGLGYNEENDFCMRINQYGFNVAMANKAFVYHYESRSFGEQRRALDAKNQKTLTGRYPYYLKNAKKYLTHSIHVCEHFADLISDVENKPLYEKKRLLFSLYEIPSCYNGTAQYGLTIFKTFFKLYSDKYDIHVLINRPADELFHLSSEYKNVYYPEDISETYHIAFSPAQVFHAEHLLLLNRLALKYVFCMQDIISVRSSYLLLDDYQRLDGFAKSIMYCDGMTSISQFSLDDTVGYYHELFDEREIPTKVIHHGLTIDNIKISDEALPFEQYIMVYGNFYKHKFLNETLPYIEKSKYNYIVLGTPTTGRISDNIYGYKSGNLSDEFVNALVSKSTGLLFPSIYEGFGLPILDGIKYDKKIIAMNSELNRELKSAFDNYGDNISLFDDLSEIDGLVDGIMKDPTPKYKGGKKEIRSWEIVAKETEAFIQYVLDLPINYTLLKQRWSDLIYVDDICEKGVLYLNKRVHDEDNWWLRFRVNFREEHPKLFGIIHRIKHGKNA